MPLENSPECKFHPGLPKFSELADVNTKCAEQTLHWLKKPKYSIRQMSRYKFNLNEIVHTHNTIREQQLKADICRNLYIIIMQPLCTCYKVYGNIAREENG